MAITRQTATVVSIIEFRPKRGIVGTTVKVQGTGFSPTAGLNTVTFNGVAATVTPASATELTVTVPAGATTGAIGVTAPGGTASSGTPFTVTSDSGAPTISGFTPAIAVAGSAVNVTGTNFETIPTANKLAFNATRRTSATVTAAAAASLDTQVPAGATSGHLVVTTPGGTAESAADFFIPPSPYAPSSVDFTGRLVVGGASLTGSISSAGKIGLVVFEGGPGQRLNLSVTNPTLMISSMGLYQPNGTLVASIGINPTAHTFDSPPLPAAGTYQLLVAGASSFTGSLTMTLSQELAAGELVTGGAPVTVTVSRPGQNARLTVNGTAGQRLSLGLTNVTLASTTVSILTPDGSSLVSGNFGTQGGALDTPPLPVSGTYAVLIDQTFGNTGSMTLTLSDEVGGTIEVGGASVPVSITRPGQRARLTFSGTAGQRLDLGLTSVTVGAWVRFFKPDGSEMVNTYVGSASALDTPSLPTTGTYAILIDPDSVTTGSMTLTLSEELSLPITPGGSAVSVSITRAGQRARLPFSATAGQRVSVTVVGQTIPGASIAVLDANGTSIGWGVQMWAPSGGFVDVKTLPATGLSAVLVDPGAAYTGNATVTLFDVPPDLSGTLTPNGPVQPITIAAPGQNASFSLTASQGQAVTASVTGSTVGCMNLRIRDGGISVNWLLQGASGSGTRTLSTAGPYGVDLDPCNANTGSAQLSVTSP